MADSSSNSTDVQDLQEQVALLHQLVASLLASPPPPAPPPTPPPPTPPLPSPSPPPAMDSMVFVGIGIAVAFVFALLGVGVLVGLRRHKWVMKAKFNMFGIQEEAPAPAMEPAVDLESGPAPAPEADADDSGVKRGEEDRRMLRERIAGLTAEDLTLQEKRAALESEPENAATAEAAEAAVSAAGSPEAALLAAVSRSASPAEVRAILRRGANPDAAFLDRGALAVAARHCALGVVQVLVDAGAMVDMKDGRGWTPLMHAIDAHTTAFSREAVIILLLDVGAAVDVWGNDLTGPLDLLAAREREMHAEAARQNEAAETAPNPAADLLIRSTEALIQQPMLHGAAADQITPTTPTDLGHILRQRSGHFDLGSGSTYDKMSPELPPTDADAAHADMYGRR